MKTMILNQLLEEIERADDLEINEIIHAVICRYSVLFPDWEISFFSLPKNDPVERRRLMDTMIKYINQAETSCKEYKS